MTRPLKVVYVTYDGLEDPLGRSQVLPYVLGLRDRGHRFEIVSFEKPGVPVRWREPLASGIFWTALRYHQRPTVPATSWDMARGAAATALQTLRQGADLIHARSYVPALMALPSVSIAGVPLLFDTRGFWADEKVDGGAWPRGDWKFRAAKRVERMLLRRAAAVAVLTLDGQRYLRREYAHASEIAGPVHVIPTAADLRRFSPGADPDPEILPQVRGARVLGYVGSLGTWYMADTMARFYLSWREAVRESAHAAPTKLLVVTRSDPSEIRNVLDGAGAAGELLAIGRPHERVPGAIRCMEAGMSFRRPALSSRFGAPVKLGEMLACGIPVASNVIGDVKAIVGGSPAGVLVHGDDEAALGDAAARLVAAAGRPDVGAAARGLAERWFDLDAALDAYDDLYTLTTAPVGVTPTDAGWPRAGRPPHQ